MTSVCVIVVIYNGMHWINQCLSSIQSSSIILNAIVIDNGSTDGTINVIKKNYPKIELVESNINLGFGKANNIGLQKAFKSKSDYVFLLNQDAWVEANTIERLIKIHQGNKDFGVLAPMQYNGEGRLIDRLFLEYSVKPSRELMTDLVLNRGALKDIYNTPFINAACWLIPYSTLVKIGGFDPLFPHYGEDNDYINRVTFHGLKVGLCPNEKVFHDRENRPKNKDFKKLKNDIYIGLLVELKNVNVKNKNVLFYLALLSISVLKMVFGKGKKYYLAQFFALLKIFKNYNKIKLHKLTNQEEYPNYIK